MNSETLLSLRMITATSAYHASRNRLRQQLIMNDSLRSIIIEVQKTHDQIIDRTDDRKPWAAENRQRCQALLITGRAGTGKTFAAETALSLLSPLSIDSGQNLDPKIIVVETPPTGTAAALAKEIIVKSGLPITREPTPRDAPGRVVSNVVKNRPTLMLWDNASHCANPSILPPAQIRKESGLMWTIAMSMLDAAGWPTPLVITGLPCLVDSLFLTDPDTQAKHLRSEASRRFRKFRIPDATIEKDGPLLEAITNQYCDLLGVSSALEAGDDIGARLVHAANYAFGTALTIAQHAVALAATRHGAKGKLKRSDFVATYNFLTGGSLEANIFQASRWSEIDPEAVLPEKFSDAAYARAAVNGN